MREEAAKLLEVVPVDETLGALEVYYKQLTGKELLDRDATRQLIKTLPEIIRHGEDFNRLTEPWIVAHTKKEQVGALELLALVRTVDHPLVTDYLVQITNSLTHLLYSQQKNVLKEQATRDSLTNLLNNKAWHEQYQKELGRNIRYRHPVTLVLLDLDGFKRVNDTAGHATGDQLLKRVAQLLVAHTREHDLLGRLGGDEFAVCLIESEPQAAVDLVRRLRIHLAPIRKQLGLNENFGISYGIASYPADSDVAEDLYALADQRLYGAKGVETINPVKKLAETNVVVCDDDPAVADVCKVILESEGFTVHQALRGEDALRLCQEVSPELMLLDISMPGMDGWAVLDRMQANEVTRYVPVVIMTGHDDEEALRQAVNTGASDFISKPFLPNQLTEVVNGVLLRNLDDF